MAQHEPTPLSRGFDPILEYRLQPLRDDPCAPLPALRPSPPAGRTTYVATFYVGRAVCSRLPGSVADTNLGIVARSLDAQLTSTYGPHIESATAKQQGTSGWEVFVRFCDTPAAAQAFEEVCMSQEYKVNILGSDVAARVPVRGRVTNTRPAPMILVQHVPHDVWKRGFCGILLDHLGLRAASL